VNFQEAIASLNEGKTECVVAKWLDGLDEANRKSIIEAVETLPLNRVYRACLSMGLNTASATWFRHFAEECKCRK